MNLSPGAATDDDDELPALAPLEADGEGVEVPEEVLVDAWEGMPDDDEVLGVDPRAFQVLVFVDDEGADDEGSPDDPIDALPDDERGGWIGDDDRPSDEVAEVDELPANEPDGGEEGPTRDPYDAVDTALPALDDGDDDEGEP